MARISFDFGFMVTLSPLKIPIPKIDNFEHTTSLKLSLSSVMDIGEKCQIRMEDWVGVVVVLLLNNGFDESISSSILATANSTFTIDELFLVAG